MTTRSQVTCHSEWAVHYPVVYHTWEVLSKTILAVLDTQYGRPAADVHVQLHQLAQTSTTLSEYTNLGIGYVLNFPIWETPQLKIWNNSTASGQEDGRRRTVFEHLTGWHNAGSRSVQDDLPHWAILRLDQS